MGFAPSIVLRAALLLGGVHPAPAIEPTEFQDWFLSSFDGTLQLDEELVERIQGFRYVFVMGLMNERSPGYLEQNVRELRGLGVPSRRIHRIAPSSDARIRENLDEIRAAFRAIADQGPEPIVIIGHSRGACDALAFALHEAAFVSERVVALFLIQGPFGGSGAADYLLGSGIPMDRQIPPPTRALATLMRNAAAKRLENGKHEGIVDLTTDASERFWGRLLAARRSAIPIVGPRTFYIEATVPPSRQPPFRRPVARYLETYYGPNDGLVAVGDQYLPELGTRLGILDVSHMDLTHRFPAARPQRRLRGALVQAIAVAVGRIDEQAERDAGRPSDRDQARSPR
ncbi:alpha/beta fold hydrolase [Tautonia sp. JC769]|uniref:alpha/beta fold hydrolase n=1 Tax=Tautonia sp. JC769 TaxID=3232135 RepID=UPI0034589CE4